MKNNTHVVSKAFVVIVLIIVVIVDRFEVFINSRRTLELQHRHSRHINTIIL